MRTDAFLDDLDSAMADLADSVVAQVETSDKPEESPVDETEVNATKDDAETVIDAAVEVDDEPEEERVDDEETTEELLPVDETESEPEPELESVEEPEALSPLHTFYASMSLPEDQIQSVEEHIVELLEWERALPAGAGELFDAVLSDQYVLVPKAQWEQTPMSPQSRTAAAPPPPASPDAAETQGDYLDEALAERVEQLDTRLNELGQKQQMTATEYEQNRWRQQFQTGLNEGMVEFAAAHDLSETDVKQIATAVGKQGIYPAFYQAANNDAKQATMQAFEAYYWTQPAYRKAELAKEAEAERQRQQETRAKKRAAASLSSSSSGPERKIRPDSTESALVDDLDKAFADLFQ